METAPQLLPIEKNNIEINIEVITNIYKMLKERNLITDVPHVKENEFSFTVPTKDGNYHIKIYKNVINSLSNAHEIIDFLNSTKEHKILVVEEINNKTEQLILTKYNDTEIFLEKNLMINLVDYIMIPKHYVLTDEEAEKVLEEYRIKRIDLPKILMSDPVVKYYNMKPKQICRIIRPSETAGLGYTYRIVENLIFIKKK